METKNLKKDKQIMTAKEMFENLGYQVWDTGWFIYYYKGEGLDVINDSYIKFFRYKPKIFINEFLLKKDIEAIEKQIEELRKEYWEL